MTRSAEVVTSVTAELHSLIIIFRKLLFLKRVFSISIFTDYTGGRKHYSSLDLLAAVRFRSLRTESGNAKCTADIHK